MFTGLIEQLGIITAIEKNENNLVLKIKQDQLLHELQIDESVAHNGICLTVEAINEMDYQVTAIAETIEKTNIDQWNVGDTVNLERAMRLSDRLGGHIVQGHVDGIGICAHIEDQKGSIIFTFSFPEKFARLIIEKGSICINGTSLTAFDVTGSSFSVAIIPYTLDNTIFKYLKIKDAVNIEFDILGKYILRDVELKG